MLLLDLFSDDGELKYRVYDERDYLNVDAVK